MPMERYVNGLLLRGEVIPDKWVIRTWECNGVMERSAVPYVGWEVVYDHGFKQDGWVPGEGLEYGVLPTSSRLDSREVELAAKRKIADAEEQAERDAQVLRKSASRSKTTARRGIIAERFNELMTLTYRRSQPDRALCKKHFKEWVRRMKRALGGEFRYVAAFERQERGSMHVHLACHRLSRHVLYGGVPIKSFELGTRIWRSIIGDDNGLCFVGGKDRFGRPRRGHMSLARMAAYVSKYILKDYEDVPSGENRFSRSIGAPKVEIETVVVDCSFADLIGLVYDYRERDSVLALRPGRFNDRLWFCKEAGQPPPLVH
ncbi:hypothetical protein [Variovorax sp. DXTD-1]|uniref:rolling circle replication-associated protein n=1 Tax=Variovorax sp. DXTD-1 TaxID=2495592 RepID=UPI000F87E703|nr:hypothetical protein [Variovorax sp. DXTD-1]RST50545.1 hypothetical protein EJI00_11845 [Variovorax sp. DXTD-1]